MFISSLNVQKKQGEWHWQWNKFYDDNKWLFTEWIYPNKLSDFKNKTVLDCGCGGGQHLNFVSPYCKSVTGIDLNTPDIARKNNKHNKNVKVIGSDLASIKLRQKFDIVYSIGVLHHTDDPSKSFNNIKKLAKKDGKVIVWVYSREGNFLNRTLIEFLKRYIFLKLPKNILWGIANSMAFLMYVPIYTIYFLPLRFLPFYEYFSNWRKLSFSRNTMNVFDKLNAPQTFFIDEKTIRNWFNKKEFSNIYISQYKGVSWRGSGTKK